ncbi:hypothetical protein LSH36_350g02025 [Paralvinella palmiformis]|uniref:DH domain-containing protein n=1 Tax=Paralvinella palmiformis TaxID=53620 RepID=A0AAD9JF19_9ANNE|nr:hypothetical protein LSH36_350g02025 [Paralvinella palmiformis]
MGGGKVDQAINYSTQLEVISHPITGESSEMRFKSDPEGKNSRSEANLPETVSPHGTLKGNQPLKSISKIFTGTKKSDQLNEILHFYSNNGLPPIPGLLQLGNKKFDPAIFRLENSWTDLVKNPQNCDRYQQEAIWELLKTEVAYIRDLQLVINMFLACLYDLQSHEMLNDIETEKIFSNIADLHQHNCLFYETHMYKIVTTARETGQPLDPTPLIHGFTEFRSFFEAYSRFCIDYMSCQQYLIRMKEENELFKIFLSWAENQRECNRLSLRDYIGKPFQRLTKYKLLLERIWREPRPDHVQAMISKVDQFICQVNATVTQLEIMRRIESYDAVDLPNNDAVAKMVGPFSRLDLTMPIPGTNRTRFLLEEGTLRMNSRTDVICFLFTDMLLITKATSKKVDVGSKVRVKVYKPPMRLDKVFIKQLNDGGFTLVYLNEYNLATTAYTFHGDQSRLWYERLRQAQADYEKLCNAIMDQSEAYLLNWANGSEHEDEFAYMNARTMTREFGLDQAGVHRQMSMSSAATSGFSEGIRSEGRRPYSIPGSEVDKLRIRSAVNLHGQNSGASPRGSPPVSPLVNKYAGNGTATNSQFYSSHQDRQHGHPDPNAVIVNPYLARQGQMAKEYYRLPQYLSSSGEDTAQRLPAGRVAPDNLKKLKQRRDRRYYTADMIQDLRHGKDASIQKRLSWHSGAKDTDYECKQRMVKSQTTSSDSLRSVYSSSGISSVGSLHPNQDQEISEEGDDIEWADPSSEDSSSVASDNTTKTRQMSSSSTAPSNVETSIRDSITSSEVNVSFPVMRQDSDTQTTPPGNLATQISVSKSMPDISRLTLLEGSGGGQRAALAELFREGRRRKLSDSQSKRLKLQLLNSTLEAT